MGNNIKLKKKKLTPSKQFMSLYTEYRDIIVRKSLKPKMEIVFRLKPTDFCRTFLVKVTLRQNKRPHIFVIDPIISKENKKRPPHLYSFEKGRICLFLDEELDLCTKFSRIIPWAAEWIVNYEIWRMTGHWNGGGHSFSKEDEEK